MEQFLDQDDLEALDDCPGCVDHGPECSQEMWGDGPKFHVWIQFDSGVWYCDLCNATLEELEDDEDE